MFEQDFFSDVFLHLSFSSFAYTTHPALTAESKSKNSDMQKTVDSSLCEHFSIIDGKGNNFS